MRKQSTKLATTILAMQLALTASGAADSLVEDRFGEAVEHIEHFFAEPKAMEYTYTTTVRSIQEKNDPELSAEKKVTSYFRRPRHYFYLDRERTRIWTPDIQPAEAFSCARTYFADLSRAL